MTDAIGGYFGLEPEGEGVFPHEQGILLNTGRNALEYILSCIPKVSGIYRPYFTCHSILEPLKKKWIPNESYHVNRQLRIDEKINLRVGEYIIVNNYFGLMDAYIQRMADVYGDRLIVDNTQAFFAPVLKDVKSFYSPRKFFGIPDGGIAYLGNEKVGTIAGFVDWLSFEQDNSGDRLEHLYLRKEQGAEAGYVAYRKNQEKLHNQPILRMSAFTMNMLRHIDYDYVTSKRRENYQYLHNALGEMNQLELPDISTFACPMVYPLLIDNSSEIREQLRLNRIYTATYWPELMLNNDIRFDNGMFARDLIPLPIDQRYGEEEMKKIIKIINNERF